MSHVCVVHTAQCLGVFLLRVYAVKQADGRVPALRSPLTSTSTTTEVPPQTPHASSCLPQHAPRRSSPVVPPGQHPPSAAISPEGQHAPVRSTNPLGQGLAPPFVLLEVMLLPGSATALVLLLALVGVGEVSCCCGCSWRCRALAPVVVGPWYTSHSSPTQPEWQMQPAGMGRAYSSG